MKSSYHLLVLVPIYLNDTIEYVEAEIQIRTMAMDFWATLEHEIKYKSNGKISFLNIIFKHYAFQLIASFTAFSQPAIFSALSCSDIFGENVLLIS